MALDFASGGKKVKVTTRIDSHQINAQEGSVFAPHVAGVGTSLTLPGGATVRGNKNVINFTDGGAFESAADLVKFSLAQTAAATAAGLDAVAETNDQLAALAETKLTDGANLNQKTTIVAVVAFAVVGALAFLFLKR